MLQADSSVINEEPNEDEESSMYESNKIDKRRQVIQNDFELVDEENSSS